MVAKHSLDLESENEKLNLFLFEMDDRQEAFVEKLEEQGYSLDYTLDSVAYLERYIQANYAQIEWKNKTNDAIELRGDCWSYLGETFRKTYGGGWRVSAEGPENVNYGKWVIEGFDDKGTEFEPLGTLQGYLLRGKPGSLKRSLEVHVNFVPTDLSDLAEDDTA